MLSSCDEGTRLSIAERECSREGQQRYGVHPALRQGQSRRAGGGPRGQDVVYQNNPGPRDSGAKRGMNSKGAHYVRFSLSEPQTHLRSTSRAVQCPYQRNPQLPGHHLGQYSSLVIPPHPASPGGRGNGNHHRIPNRWRDQSRHPAPHQLAQGAPATVFEGVHEVAGRRLQDYRSPGGNQDSRPVLALEAGYARGVACPERNVTAGTTRRHWGSKQDATMGTNEILGFFRRNPVSTTQTSPG